MRHRLPGLLFVVFAVGCATSGGPGPSAGGLAAGGASSVHEEPRPTTKPEESARRPPAPARDPAALFEGCTARPSGAYGQELRCPGVLLSVNELDGTEEDCLILTRGTFQEAAQSRGDRAALTTVTIPVAGTERRAVEVVVTKVDGQPVMAGYATARQKSPESLDCAQCLGIGASVDEARERCVPMLDEVLARGVPGVVVADPTYRPTAPRLAGRELVVPSGCQVADSSEARGTLVCGADAEEGTFVWFRFPGEGDGQGLLQVLMDRLKAGSDGDDLRERERPCRVEGVATSCRELTLSDDEDAMQALAAVATVRDERILVFCVSASLEPGPHCNDVFTLEPIDEEDAPAAPGSL